MIQAVKAIVIKLPRSVTECRYLQNWTIYHFWAENKAHQARMPYKSTLSHDLMFLVNFVNYLMSHNVYYVYKDYSQI